MATLKKHNIHSLVFNPVILAENMAKGLQDRFSAFAAEEAPGILEQVLDKHEQPGTIIRIDRLEIELGDINMDVLEADIREKLPDQLDRLLAEKIQRPMQEHEGIRFVPAAFSAIEQLEYFLLYGQLPWNAQKELFHHIDPLVEELIKDSPAAFRLLLQRVIPVENARQRLILNLEEKTLALLLDTYLGVPVETLANIHTFILWLLRKLKQAGVQVREKLFRFENLVHLLPGPLSQKKAALLTDMEKHSQMKNKNEGRGEPRVRPAFPGSLLERWLKQELQPRLFSSIDQWRAFRDSLASPPGFRDIWEILDRKLDTIERYFSPPLPEADGALAGPDHERKREGADIPFVPAVAAATLLEDVESGHLPLFVSNSGLVILWPYLKRYLDTLKLLENNRFISPQHRLQAVHELEFLVRGEEEYREYDLVLNKILCGLPLTSPVDTGFQVKPVDIGESEALIKAAVRNWKIIGKTSVQGFRNSFLKRDGKLTAQENNWTLVIDKKGFDVLLEHLPYSIHIVKLPWMEKPLYVEW